MSKRILIVDDSPYVADAFARLISHCGYETRTVYSGREATQQATAFLPDMVLMDICMPDQDGYETARQIRFDLHDTRVLLVAVTCLAEIQDQQRAFESGFNFHVPKPVGLSTLYGLLANLNRQAVRNPSTDLPLTSSPDRDVAVSLLPIAKVAKTLQPPIPSGHCSFSSSGTKSTFTPQTSEIAVSPPSEARH